MVTLKKITLFILAIILNAPNFYSQEIKENMFDTITINNQVWMNKNLDIGFFQNGDTIFHASSLEEWIEAGKNGIPAWCYYNNDSELGKEAGRLYNWYAASDKRNVAPAGWRVASSNDINKLLQFTGIDYYTTPRLASKEWENIRATDDYGFNAKPYGGRFISLNEEIYTTDTIIYNSRTRFGSIGYGVGYWLSDSYEQDKKYGYAFLLNLQVHAEVYGWEKEDGLYIRCIKEDE